MRKILYIGATAAMVLAVSATATAASASPSPQAADSMLAAATATRILVSHSESCMSIPGGSKTDGVQATQFDCEPNGPAKRFYPEPQGTDSWGNPIFTLRNEASRLCLGDFEPGSPEAGDPVRQSTCSSLWSWDKAGRLVLLASTYPGGQHLCLAVPHAWKANNIGLIVWPCNSGREQVWTEY